LVGYVELMIFTRYIYQYFFTNDNTNLYLEIIGIDSGQYYEILFWFLFYFVALQYDAYRSKVYIKYSGVNCYTYLLESTGMHNGQTHHG
jgi:hypothetical protein